MKPPEEEIRQLVAAWLRKADLDFDTAIHLSAEDRFRDVVVFHSHQAAEKYLKAILTRHQIEFPKTHELRRLLELLRPADPELSNALGGLKWLEPFGVEIRYPGDRPETLPGDEHRACQLARIVREAVMAQLEPYLSPR